MQYKLLIKGTPAYVGGSLVELMRVLWGGTASTGDCIEIYRQARSTWQLQDGGVFPFGISRK